MEDLSLVTDAGGLPALNPAPGPGTKLSLDHALETRIHSGCFEMDEDEDEVVNATELEFSILRLASADAHQMNMGWNIPTKKKAKKKRRIAKMKSAAIALEAIGKLNSNVPAIPQGLIKPQVPVGDNWAKAAEDGGDSTMLGTISATSAGLGSGSTDYGTEDDPQDQEELASVINMQVRVASSFARKPKPTSPCQPLPTPPHTGRPRALRQRQGRPHE